MRFVSFACITRATSGYNVFPVGTATFGDGYYMVKGKIVSGIGCVTVLAGINVANV